MSASNTSIYRPATDILDLHVIGDPVQAARFPETTLRFRNDRAAAQVGLDSLSDAEWIAHFGRFDPLPGTLQTPLALRYHGHQFQVYNPEIGDGRGFLFAQMRDDADRLMDLGTKGSGQTPYSRFGDGRLTLKGGVREILATEMLEALGVNTSRTFSLIETGEALERHDEPSPTRSAVLVRLSHSHIRIGSFQRAFVLEDRDLLRQLTVYVLTKIHGLASGTAEDDAIALLRNMVERAADLAASYMVAGFVHGVLNTDNINLSGESFDYGPWRFTPRWSLHFTAAYFDHNGLYAFGRQAQAIHWNLMQLAQCLTVFSAAQPLIDELDRFGDLYARRLTRRFLWRLGVRCVDEASGLALVESAISALMASDVDIDRFFHDWRGGRLRLPGSEQRYLDEIWSDFRHGISDAMPTGDVSHPLWSQADPCSMHIEEVEAIWSAIDSSDDWTPLHRKVEVVRGLGDALGPVGDDVPGAANALE